MFIEANKILAHLDKESADKVRAVLGKKKKVPTKVIKAANFLSLLDKESAKKIKELIDKKKPVKNVKAKSVTLAGIAKKLDKKTLVAIYKIIAGLPAKDYPPSSLASYIKQCEAKGRADLGRQIMDWWNNHVIIKYPQTRVNWGAATKIAEASVKKNIFKGKEFVAWLEEQVALTPQERKEVAQTTKDVVIKAPPIAIPAKNETPEMWKAEESKTQVAMQQTENKFGEVNLLVQAMKDEIKNYERKIEEYDVGGSKHTTKTGAVSKLAERVPKWKLEIEGLKVEMAKLESAVKNGQQDFQNSKNGYNHAPVTTVAYEKQAQKTLSDMQKMLIKLIEDKNWSLASQLAAELTKADKAEIAASVEIEAGILDFISNLFKKLASFAKAIFAWIKGFVKASADWHEVAFVLGR